MISQQFLDVKTGAAITLSHILIESSCMGPGDCGWSEHVLFLAPVNMSYCACQRIKEKAWPGLARNPYSAIDRVLMAQVREEDPDFVRGARTSYLKDEASRLRAELADDVAFGKGRAWQISDLTLLRSCYRDKADRLMKMERELRSLSRPATRERITEDQIQQAREFPLVNLLDGKKAGDKMLCPAHKDNNASLHIWDDHVHCYSCGWHANAIGWLMHTRQLSFIEAVRDLIS